MNKVTCGQTYEVKYTGHLMNSEDMYLHYGYANWADVSEKKMKKLKTCYKIEVTVPEGSELNFCFRANENDWDNNCGNNYCIIPGSCINYDCVEIIDKYAPETTCKVKKTTATKTTTACKTKVATAKAKTASKTGTTAKKSKE